MDYQALALLCQAAYKHDDLHVGGDTQGIIARMHGANIVAFRGTEFDFEDIIRDIRAMPWWSGELQCFVHSGFLKGARRALPIITALPGPLVLTGHSLGGALARVSAGLLQRSDVTVVTYGEPRSIMGTLPLDPHSKRFVNGRDCVPKHPYPIWGYRHQGDAAFIGEKHGRFTDHKIANYVAAL